MGLGIREEGKRKELLLGGGPGFLEKGKQKSTTGEVRP
jgi:hypothetical protein